MKNFVAVVFAFFCALLLVLPESEAMPTHEDEKLEVVAAVENDQESVPSFEYSSGVKRADRHRRVTCDLASISTPIGSVNHSACAAHCLAMLKGYRGGRCISGVCHCRR